MSIHDLVNEVVLCTRCEKPRRLGCQCWVQLRCPDCDRQRTVDREDTDPEDAVIVLLHCPSCRVGESEDPRYFDANGNELYSDEDNDDD